MDMEVAVLNFEADWLEIAPFDEDTGEWKRANCERKWVQANYLSPVQ
jgi:hypothetical protein